MKNILTFESCSFSFCNYLNLDRFVKINLSWCLCYKTWIHITPKKLSWFSLQALWFISMWFWKGAGNNTCSIPVCNIGISLIRGNSIWNIFFSNIKFFTILRDGVFFLEIIIDYLISHAMECARNCPSRNNLAPFVRAMHNSRFTHF